jgi:methionine synthase I (cobalamin-dependent)
MSRTLDRLGVEPLVGDGGMGSLLSAAVPRARCPEEANLRAPELVLRHHLEFIRAGADIIQTKSWASTRWTTASSRSTRLRSRSLARRARCPGATS